MNNLRGILYFKSERQRERERK